jgi:hypothetical protein
MEQHKIDLGASQRRAMNADVVRDEVTAALEARFEVIERAYHGDQAAMDEVLGDARLPEAVKAPLRDGGLRSRIHEQLEALADSVEGELRKGEEGRDRLLRDPLLSGSVREQLANVPSRAFNDPAVADTVVRLFRGSIMAKEAAMVAAATTETLERVHKAMTAYGDQLVRQIDRGTKDAFAVSIAQMLSRALWIVVLGVILILFIPEIPMRSVHTTVPAES